MKRIDNPIREHIENKLAKENEGEPSRLTHPESQAESNAATAVVRTDEDSATGMWAAVGASLKTQNHAPPLAAARRDRPLPLSFAQQRLWFVHQAAPQSVPYNVTFAWRIFGDLDLAALQKSINYIVSRHEILRTNLVATSDEPIQVVAASRTICIEVIDLQSSSNPLEAELQRRLTECSQVPFDLGTGSLLRAFVFRLQNDEYVFALIVHHIVCDGTSLTIFYRELQHCYHCYVDGIEPSLPSPGLQYADFATWQRDWMTPSVLESQIAYWKKQLSGKLPVIELPADRRRPATQSFAGGLCTFYFSKETIAKLEAFRKSEGTTLYNVLLAAFNALIHRYTSEEDVVIGTPMAGRNRSELRHAIGFFANTLPIRTQVAGEMSFREIVQRTKEVTLSAYANQDVPFQWLVEAIKPERDPSRPPLFQIMFAFQSVAGWELELAGLETRRIEVDTGASKFDLSLEITETPDSISGEFEYNSDLFDEATIRRMSAHFKNFITSALGDPSKPLSEIQILSASERHELLSEWNNTRMKFPEDVSIHELFERQAAKLPDVVALVEGSRRITYAELNERANHLAHHLRNLGAAPETLIGLCAKRTADLVVGILGILKSGAAYVPMDPTYPAERRTFTMQDANISILVTESDIVADWPELKDGKNEKLCLVCLDTVLEQLNTTNSENPANLTFPHHLAYVLFTSGSTGRPKGVAIEHRNVVAFASWAKATYSAEELAGVLFSTSICFDLSVFELLVTLSLGGKVILAQNALDLPTLPAAQEVTLLNTVPSAIAELLRSNGIPESVRTVNLAGEPLPTEIVDQLYSKSSVRCVYDLYGPTEDTTYSTFALRKAGEPPTIGRPLFNKQIYILDKQMQPAPIGIPGELHIGGVGLARGYLNSPELTRSKFVLNPFDKTGKSRLYKTGDLARFRADGNIEFLGRLDHQVKIRGFRIELGEIESVLKQHPNIRDAVVVPNQSPKVDKRLIGYFVPDTLQAPEMTAVRQHLKQKLPDYMIPSLLVSLTELPLTPNGKVDRKRLPVPDARPEISQYVPPTSPTEQVIARIWSQVLGVDRVGTQDDFFELGGHSLLATQILSRTQRACNVAEVTLRDFFDAPTVAGLSSVVERALKNGGKQALQIARQPRKPYPARIAQN